MIFKLHFVPKAKETLRELKGSPADSKRYKAVTKALELLEQNPRHPGLQTHPYSSLIGPNKEKVFEAYAEHKTPAAYRVFFYYGPEKGSITIIAITPHP